MRGAPRSMEDQTSTPVHKRLPYIHENLSRSPALVSDGITCMRAHQIQGVRNFDSYKLPKEKSDQQFTLGLDVLAVRSTPRRSPSRTMHTPAPYSLVNRRSVKYCALCREMTLRHFLHIRRNGRTERRHVSKGKRRKRNGERQTTRSRKIELWRRDGDESNGRMSRRMGGLRVECCTLEGRLRSWRCTTLEERRSGGWCGTGRRLSGQIRRQSS